MANKNKLCERNASDVDDFWWHVPMSESALYALYYVRMRAGSESRSSTSDIESVHRFFASDVTSQR